MTSRKVFGVILTSLLVAGLAAVQSGLAVSDPTSGSKVDYGKIVDNCGQLKTELNLIEANGDRVVRVNYGQAYASALENIFTPTNARLVSNKINNSEILDLTKDFETELVNFKANYQKYNQELSQIKTINCQNQPEKFYDKLQVVRQHRSAAHKNITKLNQLANDYQQLVNQLIDKEIHRKSDQNEN